MTTFPVGEWPEKQLCNEGLQARYGPSLFDLQRRLGLFRDGPSMDSSGPGSSHEEGISLEEELGKKPKTVRLCMMCRKNCPSHSCRNCGGRFCGMCISPETRQCFQCYDPTQAMMDLKSYMFEDDVVAPFLQYTMTRMDL